MESNKNLKGVGTAFLGVGIAFFVLGIAGQRVFLGAGIAMLALGVVFLGKSRQGGNRP